MASVTRTSACLGVAGAKSGRKQGRPRAGTRGRLGRAGAQARLRRPVAGTWELPAMWQGAKQPCVRRPHGDTGVGSGGRVGTRTPGARSRGDAASRAATVRGHRCRVRQSCGDTLPGAANVRGHVRRSAGMLGTCVAVWPPCLGHVRPWVLVRGGEDPRTSRKTTQTGLACHALPGEVARWLGLGPLGSRAGCRRARLPRGRCGCGRSGR